MAKLTEKNQMIQITKIGQQKMSWKKSIWYFAPTTGWGTYELSG